MSKKMKSILIMVMVLCFMTLCLVSFLYIRGTIRMINRGKDAENIASKTEQTGASPQEPLPTEAGMEETEQETQTQQAEPKKREYQLCEDNVWTVGIVNLYEEDDETSKVLCQIPEGTKLERVGASAKWALVRGKGIQGFVLQADISIVKP